jgi:ankyrin repeat protein
MPLPGQDQFGNTALHLTVWYEYPELYDLLASRNQAFETDLLASTSAHHLLFPGWPVSAKRHWPPSGAHGASGLLTAQVVQNNEGMTPIKLAALRASKVMMKHILRRRRELSWYAVFGPYGNTSPC